MKRSQDRLTKVGVAALAGIAVLGWVREPERHQLPDKAGRVTFQPPADTIGPPVIRELPGDPRPDPFVLPKPVERVRSLPPASEARSRQEGRSRDSEEQPVTAPPRVDPQPEVPQVETREAEPELRTEPADVPRDDNNPRADQPNGPTQPVVRAKERSTGRSAAIIAGTAAAGAAIGGLSGGGKGAVIGAITGGAGGYVYDRMTRRRGTSAPPDITYRDNDDRSDGPSLARQFGTPSYTGR